MLNDQNEWEVYAIEINLRKGGTTHPFLTLQFLTDGALRRRGRRVPHAARRAEVLRRERSRALAARIASFTHDDLFDIVARHGLHFDQSRQKGVVFHMINGVGEQGALGLTAVGNTREEAEALYQKTVEVLDAEAEKANK